MTTHFQTITMGQFDIALITLIDAVTAFCRLQIDIGHLRIFADSLPEDLSLIV